MATTDTHSDRVDIAQKTSNQTQTIVEAARARERLAADAGLAGAGDIRKRGQQAIASTVGRTGTAAGGGAALGAVRQVAMDVGTAQASQRAQTAQRVGDLRLQTEQAQFEAYGEQNRLLDSASKELRVELMDAQDFAGRSLTAYRQGAKSGEVMNNLQAQAAAASSQEAKQMLARAAITIAKESGNTIPAWASALVPQEMSPAEKGREINPTTGRPRNGSQAKSWGEYAVDTGVTKAEWRSMMGDAPFPEGMTD